MGGRPRARTLQQITATLDAGQLDVVTAFLSGLARGHDALDLAGGSCEETDPDVFYPEKGENNHVPQAKAVCRGCEIREQCLETALAADERFGIWGGLSTRERDVLVVERRRILLDEAG
jgi:hypothetical protein